MFKWLWSIYQTILQKLESAPTKLADYFRERNSSCNRNEVKLDEVNRTGWLDVNVTNKLVSINNIWSIVGRITDHQVIEDTTLSLNRSQVWVDHRQELGSGEVIVEFE